MNIRLSKKQENLLNDIISPNKTEIYVLGSTQSGKTFDICLATLMYAQALYNYNPNETYFVVAHININKANLCSFLAIFFAILIIFL